MSVNRNRGLWAGEFDLSGHLQGMSFATTVEMQDDTVEGDASRSNAAGLDAFELSHEGVWSAGVGLPDAVLWSQRGLANVLATVAPVDKNEGSLAYFMRTTQGLYAPTGEIGSLLRFSVNLMASGGKGAVRGTLMVNANLSSSSSGTARQLGAPASAVYAGLHVVSADGSSPTLDVVVESDDAMGFGSPTTRLTFAQATGPTSEWLVATGPIADDWWRVSWTIGGTGGPNFDAVVSIAIE